MVIVYAQISLVGNSYWQKHWSSRSGNSIQEKNNLRCSLEKKVHTCFLIQTSLIGGLNLHTSFT